MNKFLTFTVLMTFMTGFCITARAQSQTNSVGELERANLLTADHTNNSDYAIGIMGPGLRHFLFMITQDHGLMADKATIGSLTLGSAFDDGREPNRAVGTYELAELQRQLNAALARIAVLEEKTANFVAEKKVVTIPTVSQPVVVRQIGAQTSLAIAQNQLKIANQQFLHAKRSGNKQQMVTASQMIVEAQQRIKQITGR